METPENSSVVCCKITTIKDELLYRKLIAAWIDASFG
jgi:hypothetical protein